MDCNKEEAVMAQQSAAKKMESKDFNSARKLAAKAQLLYPSLDNILQMITVCDVHCSAEKKRFGNDKDWYGILQIASTADEASIKKQYRKFALLLHPDKNKFAGADDAFKLIGEAQRVLLDVDKCRSHDTARTGGRPNATNRAPHQHTTTVRPPNMRNPPWVHNNFNFSTNTNMNNSTPGENNRSFHNSPETFWTACPYCFIRYEFYKDVMNKLLYCQSCNRTFTGVQVNSQGAAFGSTFARPVKTIFRPTPPSGVFVKVTTGLGGKSSIPNSVNIPQKKRQMKESKSNRKANGKRRKQVVESSESSSSSHSRSKDSEEGEDVDGVVESSESCKSESSSDDEEVVVKMGSKNDSATGQNPGGFDERYPRRSSGSKPNVSYNEKNGNDYVKDPSKTAKDNGAPLDADEQKVEDLAKNEKNGENETEKETAKKTEIEEEEVFDDDNSSENEPRTYEYPDPDFSDFGKDREEKCFKTEQIWAAYDPSEALPRFYARIKKVLSPGFKLRITWLEPCPDEDSEINWVNADLPISCGNYRHGKSEITEDLLMFSHMVYWEKGNGRDTFKIYPVKGETWALFKNWDINWGLEPDSNRTYSYEFVEVLSNFVDEAGICVAYLSKVKGFCCLFCRTSEDEKDNVQIAGKDILRFSHRVPSFKMTGKEREGVPKGSFELDPAALPTNLAIPEIDISNLRTNGASSSSMKNVNPI